MRDRVEVADVKPRTYGNWRKPMSAGLGRFGLIGTGLMFASLIVVILSVGFFGLLAALVLGVILSVMLATLVIRDRHGRTLLQRAGVRVGWRRTRAAGAHLYRAGPLGRNPWGTFQLPGLAARSVLSEARDAWDRPFALLHMPTTKHYSVVFGAQPDGASLVDQRDVDVWVAHWGDWLASLAEEPGLVAASVTVETAPDSGARLQREVTSRMDPSAPQIARDMLNEVMQTYPAGSATIKAYVALTFTAAPRDGAKRRDTQAVARDLAARLPGLTQGLSATGAGAASPLSAQQLCEVVRVAYEPRAAALIDEAYSEGTVPQLAWSDVGPAGAEARWGSYRHDGATSVTWSMSSAPRGAVQSSVLLRLLVPHRDIARKRVTLLYRPMAMEVAAQTVEADKRNADFRVKTADRPSARALRESAAANRTAEDEASGNGLVSFGMLVTATSLHSEDLDDIEAAIRGLAGAARITLRPVYGSQDSAFAACLPLGLVLSKHLNVPAALRAAL
jgi:hypothetical protein